MLPDLTPLMRQYRQVKQRYPDAILFFRVGDFYEMFYEDAIEGSRLLEIALTSRDKHKADQVPLCGVPYHAATSYIAKLLRVGRSVAVCDQVEDPQAAKGLVRREVVRVTLRPIGHDLRLPDEPVGALCDRERVAQIMRILLDNALRHTPLGTNVTVIAARDNGAAQLAVRDAGPGLDLPPRGGARAAARAFSHRFPGRLWLRRQAPCGLRRGRPLAVRHRHSTGRVPVARDEDAGLRAGRHDALGSGDAAQPRIGPASRGRPGERVSPQCP